MKSKFGSSQFVRVSLAVAVLLSACTKDAPMKDMAMAKVTVPANADYTVDDVRFMQGMIHHHAQAIAMASLSPTHAQSDRVKKLSEKIVISQRDEIALMKSWLSARHQAVPDPDKDGPMMMPGMLTAEQMKALAAANDTTFDRLFLTGMIQHHQGAITMVADLIATGSATASEMFGYANGIDNDQRAEIAIMQQMLTPPTRSGQ